MTDAIVRLVTVAAKAWRVRRYPWRLRPLHGRSTALAAAEVIGRLATRARAAVVPAGLAEPRAGTASASIVDVRLWVRVEDDLPLLANTGRAGATRYLPVQARPAGRALRPTSTTSPARSRRLDKFHLLVQTVATCRSVEPYVRHRPEAHGADARCRAGRDRRRGSRRASTSSRWSCFRSRPRRWTAIFEQATRSCAG